MSYHAIPARWLNCPSFPNDLVAGIFFPIKTPLDSKFQVPTTHLFTPSTVMSIISTHTHKLRFWIDLTITNRYYDKSEIESQDIKYFKLHQNKHTPNVMQTFDFIDECATFRSNHPDEGIVVHCTHGFNRTGFLIVSYLIEVLSWTLEDAITEFARARPPGIFEEDYLRKLFKRYKKPQPNSFPSPPDWSESENCEVINEIARELPKGIREIKSRRKLKRIRQEIRDLCEWCLPGFPGVQLESVINTEFFREEAYRVSWKADGTRYMLYIAGEDQVYLLDKENCLFQVENLRFLKRGHSDIYLEDTLVDGELVVEKKGEETVLTYLIFDLIRIEGENLGSNFDRRRQYIDKEIVQPLIHFNDNNNFEPFGVKLKEFWDISYSGMLVSDKFMKNLTHSCDGLVFQPAKSPYLAGRNRRVLKWKPPDLNTIDFRLVIDKKGTGLLFVEHSNSQFGEIEIVEDIVALNGKLIECSYVDGEWKFVRERKDKSVPNSFTVANIVWKAITYPISEEKLLTDIGVGRWKAVRKEAPTDSPPAKRMKFS